jgi:threonyl-tRNA synthetase
MKVVLPDGAELEVPDGATGQEVAASIGPGLAKAALAIRANGEVRDLSAPVPDGAEIAILTDGAPDSLDLIRHDAAHVMATAVTELYPGTKVSIGPPIENGFYYDFEFPEDVKVTDADLERIEERMQQHISADEPFERSDISVEEAERRFAGRTSPTRWS